jgi:hypothetical protein
MADGEASLVPSEIDLKLRIGIFRLLDIKYRSQFGNQSNFLCAGILNWALLEAPGNAEAERFLEDNRSLIEREAMKICLDSDLSLAVSILYTFTLIRLGPNDSERSMSLADRATELSIAIHQSEELYPTDDAVQFLTFIDEYASRLLGPKA